MLFLNIFINSYKLNKYYYINFKIIISTLNYIINIKLALIIKGALFKLC